MATSSVTLKSGVDTNPGTKAKPFQTFRKAQEAIAKAIPTMTGNMTVTFAGGRYPVTETIVFGPKDSAKG